MACLESDVPHAHRAGTEAEAVRGSQRRFARARGTVSWGESPPRPGDTVLGWQLAHSKGHSEPRPLGPTGSGQEGQQSPQGARGLENMSPSVTVTVSLPLEQREDGGPHSRGHGPVRVPSGAGGGSASRETAGEPAPRAREGPAAGTAGKRPEGEHRSAQRQAGVGRPGSRDADLRAGDKGGVRGQRAGSPRGCRQHRNG